MVQPQAGAYTARIKESVKTVPNLVKMGAKPALVWRAANPQAYAPSYLQDDAQKGWLGDAQGYDPVPPVVNKIATYAAQKHDDRTMIAIIAEQGAKLTPETLNSMANVGSKLVLSALLERADLATQLGPKVLEKGLEKFTAAERARMAPEYAAPKAPLGKHEAQMERLGELLEQALTAKGSNKGTAQDAKQFEQQLALMPVALLEEAALSLMADPQRKMFVDNPDFPGFHMIAPEIAILRPHLKGKASHAFAEAYANAVRSGDSDKMVVFQALNTDGYSSREQSGMRMSNADRALVVKEMLLSEQMRMNDTHSQLGLQGLSIWGNHATVLNVSDALVEGASKLKQMEENFLEAARTSMRRAMEDNDRYGPNIQANSDPKNDTDVLNYISNNRYNSTAGLHEATRAVENYAEKLGQIAGLIGGKAPTGKLQEALNIIEHSALAGSYRVGSATIVQSFATAVEASKRNSVTNSVGHALVGLADALGDSQSTLRHHLPSAKQVEAFAAHAWNSLGAKGQQLFSKLTSEISGGAQAVAQGVTTVAKKFEATMNHGMWVTKVNKAVAMALANPKTTEVQLLNCIPDSKTASVLRPELAAGMLEKVAERGMVEAARNLLADINVLPVFSRATCNKALVNAAKNGLEDVVTILTINNGNRTQLEPRSVNAAFAAAVSGNHNGVFTQLAGDKKLVQLLDKQTINTAFMDAGRSGNVVMINEMLGNPALADKLQQATVDRTFASAAANANVQAVKAIATSQTDFVAHLDQNMVRKVFPRVDIGVMEVIAEVQPLAAMLDQKTVLAAGVRATGSATYKDSGTHPIISQVMPRLERSVPNLMEKIEPVAVESAVAKPKQGSRDAADDILDAMDKPVARKLRTERPRDDRGAVDIAASGHNVDEQRLAQDGKAAASKNTDKSQGR